MRDRLGCRAVLSLVLGVAFVVSQQHVVLGQPRAASRTRLYEDGPLTARDFQATPPPPQKRTLSGGGRALAWTFTEIRYKYNFATLQKAGVTTATLTKIDLQALLRRDQSWNVAPENRNLMDHEQGHFDITAIHTGRARLEFKKLITGEGLRAQGADAAAAQRALEEKLRARVDSIMKNWRDAQTNYDRVTLSGRNRRAQAQERRTQQEMLKVLNRAAASSKASR